ncbi:hypothetical protein BX666DRAFT_265899 [Dichotomocladium elegans]|nr:hypothetical protein BX666DRAFT_265899 [Dichotomocladium elegans]
MDNPLDHGSPDSITPDSSKKSLKQKDPPGPATNAQNRRNKTTRACDECRKRKVKCDGVQPCARCRKSETPCVFAKIPPKRGPPKQYVELLEQRLQVIERALQSIDGPARRILNNALASSTSPSSSVCDVMAQEGKLF